MKRNFLYVSVLMLFIVFASAGALQALEYDRYGPHADEIFYTIITEHQARVLSLERGDASVLPGLAQAEYINRLYRREDIELTFDQGFHMFYAGFNMTKEPLDDVVLRRAISHAVDREQLVNTIFEGYMDTLTTYIPPASPFHNPDTPFYEYDPDRARALLDEAGYLLDEEKGLRIDPRTGEVMREIVVNTPTFEVAPTSAQLGQFICEAAQEVGLNLVHEPLDFNVIVANVMAAEEKEYDIYTLAWSLSRNPTSLFDFFHSSNIGAMKYNTVGMDDYWLDLALEDFYYALEEEEAMSAAKQVQELLYEHEPYLLLYSRPYIDAFRSDLVTGYVPMVGYGAASDPMNLWTALNIRPIDEDGQVVWVLSEELDTLNPTVADTAYEWDVLRRFYDPLFTVAAEDLEELIPWLAKDWEVEFWEPDAEAIRENELFAGIPIHDQAHKVTYLLQEGLKWSDGDDFTAEDIKFTVEFLRDNQIGRYSSDVREIVRVDAPDPQTVEIYFSTASYWNLYNIYELPWLKPEFWEDVDDYTTFEPWLEPHPDKEGMTKLVSMGPFYLAEYEPGEYVRIVKNEHYWRLPE